MIKIIDETLISAAEAAEYLPSRRGSKSPAVSTIYRWMSAGVDGVQLDWIQCGSTRFTSVEALQRFCERLREVKLQALERRSHRNRPDSEPT